LLHVALWEPEIPPNTGNVARLCVATGCPLHLVGRLGFRLDDRSLRRAGLDYWRDCEIHRHATLAELERAVGSAHIVCFTAHVQRLYTSVSYHPGDCLLFGGESHGLPAEVIAHFAERAVSIPMPGDRVRSLNLATAVGIGLYEGLRQLHYW
jgi:tRNA (cytidine/uridine-2'-O-)-methyltransferase